MANTTFILNRPQKAQAGDFIVGSVNIGGVWYNTATNKNGISKVGKSYAVVSNQAESKYQYKLTRKLDKKGDAVDGETVDTVETKAGHKVLIATRLMTAEQIKAAQSASKSEYLLNKIPAQSFKG